MLIEPPDKDGDEQHVVMQAVGVGYAFRVVRMALLKMPATDVEEQLLAALGAAPANVVLLSVGSGNGPPVEREACLIRG